MPTSPAEFRTRIPALAKRKMRATGLKARGDCRAGTEARGLGTGGLGTRVRTVERARREQANPPSPVPSPALLGPIGPRYLAAPRGRPVPPRAPAVDADQPRSR